VLPVSVKDAEESIMGGSSEAGAASVSPSGLETGPGKVDASEMQVPRMPAESNNTTRATVLLRESVILFMSSDEMIRKIEVCGIAEGKARILGVPQGA
jgi:hypothetical protein